MRRRRLQRLFKRCQTIPVNFNQEKTRPMEHRHDLDAVAEVPVDDSVVAPEDFAERGVLELRHNAARLGKPTQALDGIHNSAARRVP